MFEQNSRYANLETATYVTADGEQIAYKRRRFLPRGSDLPLLVEIAVTEGDRLDRLTARTLGDPEQFWRLCDASDAVDPEELEKPGETIRVPIPTV